MLNNRLGLGVVNGELETKLLPASDDDVAISDMFYFEWTMRGFNIRPYGSSNCITMTSTSTADLSLASGSGSAEWSLVKYTGANRSEIPTTIVGDYVAGETLTVSAYSYSTLIDANAPTVSLGSNNTASATLTWNESTQIATIALHDEGSLHISCRVYYGNSTTTAFYRTPVYTVTLPFAEGTYYIVNKEYNKYLAEDTTLELSTPEDQNYQKWNINHVGDGYYKILCVSNSEALSVQTSSVVTSTYTGASNMLWKVVEKNGAYYLQVKSSLLNNDNDKCMLVQESGGYQWYELPIIEGVYTDDDDRGDEWYLFRVSDNGVFLLGITDNAIDHELFFSNVMSSLSIDDDLGFKVTVKNIDSKTEVKQKMANSRIFVSLTHGNYDDNGTYIALDNYVTTTSLLHSTDIYNFNTNTALVNLSGCELVIFVGCYTGVNQGKNLVDAAIAAGAEAAIGFEYDVQIDDGGQWLQFFFEKYSLGETIEAATAYACNESDGIAPYYVYISSN